MIFTTVILVLLFCNGCSGCGEGCSQCAGISQLCLGCNDGYWLHTNNCKRCPENCERCSDDENCSECKTGFYGTRCLPDCTFCSDGLCDIDDGHCINGCIDGYFEGTANTVKTCRKCSDNCKLCRSQEICSDCDRGFFNVGYRNASGDLVVICYPCLSVCEDCRAANNCTVCKPGTYGRLCQHTCTANHCYRCNKSENTEKCTECIFGYRMYNNTCVSETFCSQNCQGCDENGHCAGGCKDGWSGQTCTNQCTHECNECDQNNHTICTTCKDDSFGYSCDQPCSEQCFRISLEETCRLQDGYCLNGCKKGFWGNQCNNMCDENCLPFVCNQTNGKCEQCQRNHYGPACEYTCSLQCRDDRIILNICRKSDGKCELGCESDYSGDTCETFSSTRITTFPTSDKSDLQNNEQDNSETVFYLLGIVTGVVISLVVAAAVVGLICFLRRKRKLTSETNNTFGNTEQMEYENTSIGMRTVPSTETDYYNKNKGYDQEQLESSLNVYEGLQDSQQEEDQQYTGLV